MTSFITRRGKALLYTSAPVATPEVARGGGNPAPRNPRPQGPQLLVLPPVHLDADRPRALPRPAHRRPRGLPRPAGRAPPDPPRAPLLRRGGGRPPGDGTRRDPDPARCGC